MYLYVRTVSACVYFIIQKERIQMIINCFIYANYNLIVAMFHYMKMKKTILEFKQPPAPHISKRSS